MTPPTLEEAKAYAAEIGLPETEAEHFWFYYDSQDWKRANGIRLSKWRSALQVWRLSWSKRSHYSAPPRAGNAPRNDFQPQESVWSLKQRKEALEASMAKLAFKSRHESPMGNVWANDQDRLEYIRQKRQVEAINEQIARTP